MKVKPWQYIMLGALVATAAVGGAWFLVARNDAEGAVVAVNETLAQLAAVAPTSPADARTSAARSMLSALKARTSLPIDIPA